MVGRNYNVFFGIREIQKLHSGDLCFDAKGTQAAFTCLKPTIETPAQYVISNQS